MGLTRAAAALASAVLVGGTLSTAAAADVRIGVFGLFHPRELILRHAGAGSITLRAGATTCVRRAEETARVSAVAGSVRASCGKQILESSVIEVTSEIGGVADIEVRGPGRIVRAFRGRIQVRNDAAELQTVVTMDLETAVASVTAAELPDGSPLEALKAVAVAARSYFVAARSGHRGFDFCDTTHCQYLREHPALNHPATRAAAETAGLVLTFRNRPIAGFHSARCGGHTRSLDDAGMASAGGYPYFSVDCPACQRSGLEWTRRLSLDDEVRQLDTARSEAARLAVVRRLGWAAVPSTTFDSHTELDVLVLRGRGAGHGIGLCQVGAIAMARDGDTTFRQILSSYYPQTTVMRNAQF
jgi:stage II sporulation protein D